MFAFARARISVSAQVAKVFRESMIKTKPQVSHSIPIPSLIQTNKSTHLTTETVQCATLSLESVDNVEGGDGLALGVLGVGDCITDDALEESLQNTTGLFVNH